MKYGADDNVRIDMINTVREEMRDQVTVVIRSLQDLMIMSSLVLVVGFGSVCEGTFPDPQVKHAAEYPGIQNFFLELYAFLAALTLVLSLGSLLLAMFLSMELENFLSACTADLQRHVRRALQRDWPARRSEEVQSSLDMRDKDALQAVLEDARCGSPGFGLNAVKSQRDGYRMGEDIEKQPLLEKSDSKAS
eukprot:s6085_g1.t1